MNIESLSKDLRLLYAGYVSESQELCIVPQSFGDWLKFNFDQGAASAAVRSPEETVAIMHELLKENALLREENHRLKLNAEVDQHNLKVLRLCTAEYDRRLREIAGIANR